MNPAPTTRRHCFFGSKAPYLSYLSQFAARAHECETDFAVSTRAASYVVRYFSQSSNRHTLAIREILREAGGDALEKEPVAQQILERELIKECKELASHVSTSTGFHSSGQLALDHLFAQRIAKIGQYGKKLAEEIRTASLSWSQAYWSERRTGPLFKLWVDPEMEPYHCRFLKLLAEILWKDRGALAFEKSRKQIPAITQSVYRPLIRILSSRASVLLKNAVPSMLFDGKVIAEAAAVDPKLLPLIEKGLKFFNSIYHHKLLRFECRKGFENWVEGKVEPRMIKIDGGAAELAFDLGFKFKEAPAILKAILHAQAYMNFVFDDGTQKSLIELRKYRTPTTRRFDGLEILLADQLMPYYTFQTTRQGKLLVPLTEFPSFASAPQYQAGQALLQMLVMEEFTQRSLELAQQGAIEISREKWDDFYRQSGLPESVFKKTCEHWAETFLIQTSRYSYTLGENYRKELRFLQTQGALRKERQRQGRISVQKRHTTLSLARSAPSSFT